MLGDPKVEGLPRGFALREEYESADAVPLTKSVAGSKVGERERGRRVVGGGERRLYGAEWILRPAEVSIARRASPGWKACCPFFQ